MNLTIADRLVVLDILPATGDILTVKIIRDLRHSLEFTEEELKECNITQDTDRVIWDKDIEKDIDISPKALSIIVEALEQYNKDKKLTLAHLPVYEKFIGE